MTQLQAAPDQTRTASLPARQHRAELIADIAASAIRYRGQLRDLADFHELDALCRPSILRRVTAELAAAIPRGTDRILGIGWPASILATALSLHAGIPLAILPTEALSAPERPIWQDGITSGEVVALVAESSVSADAIEAVRATLADRRFRPSVMLSVLPVAPGALDKDVRRVALLSQAELNTAIPGSTQ
jgi:hypothetical protein